jgi:hypothetical protein
MEQVLFGYAYGWGGFINTVGSQVGIDDMSLVLFFDVRA